MASGAWCGSDPGRQTPPDGGGTLVWVGPTDRPECMEAFRYCAERALQIAPRRTLEDLIARPAERVGRMVVARMDRAAASDSMLRQLATLFPNAEKTLLLGTDCEGEGRTGEPWPQFDRVYWHRWNQIVPAWFADRTHPTPLQSARGHYPQPTPFGSRALRQNIAVIATSQSLAEGLLDAVAVRGHSVVWLPAMIPASVRNVDICLWDDSAAAPTSTALWRERLAFSAWGPVRQRPRHAWLAGFPRVEDWAAARRAGVEGLISKPFTNQVIHDFIDHHLHAIPGHSPNLRTEPLRTS